MPRRQQPFGKPYKGRGRRGKPSQPQPQIVVKGRNAKAVAAELIKHAERHENRAAKKNDLLALSGAWRFRYHTAPFIWLAGLAAAAGLRVTQHPIVFGAIAGLVAPVLLVWLTRHLSAFARKSAEVAAVLTSVWVPVIAAFGLHRPVPALLIATWVPCVALWVRKYRWRAMQAETVKLPTSDILIWEKLAARRKWSGQLVDPEDIPGGRKWLIQLDGIETHIGQVMTEPRAIAAAWHKARTEVYAEPHPSAVESRGILTILKQGILDEVRPWDGHGFGEDGIATVGRFADSQPTRIRAWVPRDGTRNGLVAGASGGGKSELLNLLVWLALRSPVPIVPIILDPQNGQSLPQWQDKVLYASGVEECARMVRGLNAGMMDRSRRLAQMTWDDDGHKAKGMNFFDARLTGLPIVMAIIDEAPLLLSGDGNVKLAAEMVRLTAGDTKLGRKAGVSKWLVAQVPSLAELGGDQALRSMLVGGNVLCLRTGDKVSAGMVGLEADPSTLPKFFPDGEPTSGLGYAVTMDNRQAPMRSDLVPGRMRHEPVTVPPLEDEFLEAMDRAMGTQGVLLPSAPVPVPVPAGDSEPQGRRCVDAVWQVLSDRGEDMKRGEVIEWVTGLSNIWGRDKPFAMRSITDALQALTEGKEPGRKIMRIGDPGTGVYRSVGASTQPSTEASQGEHHV